MDKPKIDYECFGPSKVNLDEGNYRRGMEPLKLITLLYQRYIRMDFWRSQPNNVTPGIFQDNQGFPEPTHPILQP